MEPNKTENNAEKQQLIQGILKDAEAEAERIAGESEKSIAERKSAVDAQCLRIREEAETRTAEQTARILKINEISIAAIRRRNGLKTREALIKEVLERAEKELESLIETPEYPDILLSWIVEAAIGLNTEEAQVNATIKEREIADGLLPKAEKLVNELTGRKCIIELAGADPVSGQGIVLSSKNGNIAFSNQVKTRMVRYQNEIREMIYGRLFEET